MLDTCPPETQVEAFMNKETRVCFLLENYKLPLMAKMKREQSEVRNVIEGVELQKMAAVRGWGVFH